ncbi:MAG: hypothetical protein EOO61_01825 [Hymenobacter sp.]|nr:MAG: hypothetical protein EOO61_01825 [Hymenobacter sp.]
MFSYQQFNLLKKAALLPNARARYIAPMFHKDKNDDDEEAFYNFFRLPSINAMQYVCSIDFEQFIKPDYVLSEDDSHKICYSAESIKSNTGYLFSSPTAIKITNNILELQQERLVFDDIPEQFYSLDETIRSIRNIFSYSNDNILNSTNDKINLINTIQLQILSIHNIFWIPVLRSISERRNRIISSHS